MAPISICVVYQSGGGHTRRLAESLAKGCESIGDIEVHLLEIKGSDVHEGRWNNSEILAKCAASDAIALGCATYMGSGSAIFKAFLETAFGPWKSQSWKDKFGCGFTNSASQNGDKLSTLIQLAIFGAQMGLIWVGVGDGPGNNWSGGSVNDNNRLGSWIGAMGQSNGDHGPDLAPSPGDLLTAERLGKRLAEVTARWHGRTEYATERVKLS